MPWFLLCFLFVREYSLFVNKINCSLFVNKKEMNNCSSNSTILVPNCWIFSKKSTIFLKIYFQSQKSPMKYNKIVNQSHKNGIKLGKYAINQNHNSKYILGIYWGDKNEVCKLFVCLFVIREQNQFFVRYLRTIKIRTK